MAWHIGEIFMGRMRQPTASAMDELWRQALQDIKRGAERVDCRSLGGDLTLDYTLLHIACAFGNEDAVRQLLAAGANPSLADGCIGNTPMHFAVGGFMRWKALSSGARLAVCKMLPQKDVATPNKYGDTPLMRAVSYNGDANVIQWALQHPLCNVHAKNRSGRTALDRLRQAFVCHDQKAMFKDMLAAEIAARARWTALRAVWCGACAAV